MEVNSREADVAAFFDRGLHAHNAGDLSSAELLYQETLAIQPDHSEANHNIGMVLVTKNELDKALKFFKYALDTSPNVSLFWASYIDVLIKLDRITESKTLIKAVKDAGIHCKKIEAISNLLSVEYQDPGPNDAQKIAELIETQKFDDAIKTCLNLMDTYPSSAVLNINLGKCYFELEQIEPAIASYKTATEYQPEWATAFILLGQLYSSQKNSNQAIECLKRAIDLQPDDPDLYAALGAEFIKNGDFDGAIDYFDKNTKQDPNSSFILSLLGDAYNSKADHRSAIDYYTQALELEPGDAITHFNMGNAFQAMGNYTAAIESYQQTININPYFTEVFINLGVAQKDKGDTTTAIKTFKRVLKIDPNCADAYYNMGNVLGSIGDHKAALDSFEEAIKIRSDYTEAYLDMGEIYFTLGDYQCARNCFNNVNCQYAIAKSVECLFFLNQHDEFDNVLDTLTKTDPTNIRVAAISSFAANQRKQENVYPFCKDPIELVNFSNLKHHFSNPKKFITNILDEMDKKDTSWEPKNKTTKAGFQTSGNIFDKSNKTITLLEDIISKELDLYFEKFKSSGGVLFDSWPKGKDLNGWFVRMVQNGHQSSHIHASGWVSGVLYLKTVKCPINNEGAIEFSLQGYNYPIIRDNYPRRLHQPIDGEIVMFPSSLFHRTIPVIKDVERSVIAFDLHPG